MDAPLIIMFLLYLIQLGIFSKQLGALELAKQRELLSQGEDKIFQLIKMHPSIIPIKK
jgi:hypothetical protein